MNGEYGKNQWKIRLFYIVKTIVTIAVIAFLFVKIYIFAKSKYIEYKKAKESTIAETQNPITEEQNPVIEENEIVNSLPVFTYASASSILAPIETSNNTYYYYANNVLSENLNTCWSEGVAGNGEGESLLLQSDTQQKISKLWFYNGLMESEELFYKNGRAKDITLEFSDGIKKTFVLSGEYFEQPLKINFDEPILSDFIKITIDSTWSGEKYEDTCITFIKVE